MRKPQISTEELIEIIRKEGEIMLIVENVTKSIQTKKILQDCGLSVQAGQICGLAGPNGSGKTTLLSCIAGILIPESGDRAGWEGFNS